MKSDNIRKYGEITLELLLAISYVAEDLLVTFDPRKLNYSPRYGSLNGSRLFDHLRGLKKTGYIDFSRLGERNYSIKLTNKGKIKLLENSKDNKADGKWRVLSFDIPENMRRKRDLFRRSIKRIGFKQVQKSLWVCPFCKADEVKLAIDEYDLNQFVAYMIVVETDIENYLKGLFRQALQ